MTYRHQQRWQQQSAYDGDTVSLVELVWMGPKGIFYTSFVVSTTSTPPSKLIVKGLAPPRNFPNVGVARYVHRARIISRSLN